MKQTKEEFLELLEQGDTKEEIMNKFGWCSTNFHKYFKECFPGRSIKHYSKKVDHKYFKNLNSANKCYLLGFFLADGCLSSQNKKGILSCFQVSVKREDENILNFFKEEISKELTLQHYENADGYKVSKIQWTSENMANDLLQYVSSLKRKSFDGEFDINMESVPDIYFGDFLRGLLDGDGTVKLGFPKIEILFSSKVFAEKIQSKLRKLVPLINVSIIEDSHYSKSENEKRTCKIYRLFISASTGSGMKPKPFHQMNILYYINVFYYFLYNNSKFYLPRKKLRFTEYRAKFQDFERLENSVEHSE